MVVMKGVLRHERQKNLKGGSGGVVVLTLG